MMAVSSRLQLALLAICCANIQSQVLEIQACEDLEAGDPCAVAGPMNTVLHGNCSALLPSASLANSSGRSGNWSYGNAAIGTVLSCMLHSGGSWQANSVGTGGSSVAEGDDRICLTGLLHSSGACCPRWCQRRCGAAGASIEQSCNVDYILRVAPTCGSPPCVVAGTQGTKASIEMALELNLGVVTTDDEAGQAASTEPAPETLRLQGTVRWGTGAQPPATAAQQEQAPTFFERLAVDEAAGVFLALAATLVLCCGCIAVPSIALRTLKLSKLAAEPGLLEPESRQRPPIDLPRSSWRQKATPSPAVATKSSHLEDDDSLHSYDSFAPPLEQVLGEARAVHREEPDELRLDVDPLEPIPIVDIWAEAFLEGGQAPGGGSDHGQLSHKEAEPGCPEVAIDERRVHIPRLPLAEPVATSTPSARGSANRREASGRVRWTTGEKRVAKKGRKTKGQGKASQASQFAWATKEPNEAEPAAAAKVLYAPEGGASNFRSRCVAPALGSDGASDIVLTVKDEHWQPQPDTTPKTAGGGSTSSAARGVLPQVVKVAPNLDAAGSTTASSSSNEAPRSKWSKWDVIETDLCEALGDLGTADLLTRLPADPDGAGPSLRYQLR